MEGSEWRVQGGGFRVYGLVCRVQGVGLCSGCRVRCRPAWRKTLSHASAPGCRMRVEGLEIRDQGLGFRVQGLGFRV